MAIANDDSSTDESPTIGIDHPTVVPENYDPDDGQNADPTRYAVVNTHPVQSCTKTDVVVVNHLDENGRTQPEQAVYDDEADARECLDRFEAHVGDHFAIVKMVVIEVDDLGGEQ